MQLISFPFLPLRKFPNLHGNLRDSRRSYPIMPQPNYCAMLLTRSATQEGTVLAPGLLRSFVHVIRQRENPTSDIHKILSPLFSSVTNRLASVIDQSILGEQYEVTRTLYIVIDAIADVSMSGISHDNLYQPSIGLLDG